MEPEEYIIQTTLLETEQDLTDARVRARDAFTVRDFLIENGADPKKLPKEPPAPKPEPEPKPQYTSEFTVAEKNEALSIFLEQPTAPPEPTTPGSKKALEKLLKRFDYTMPDSTNKMRQYLIFKLFELAENDDPKLAIKALEMLGKVSEIGLFSTKIEVSSTDRPTTELETELNKLLNTYSLGAIDTNYQEITDAELRGDDIEEAEFEEYEEGEEEDE